MSDGGRIKYRKPDSNEIKSILESHKRYRTGDTSGQGRLASFAYCDLSHVDFSGCDLEEADFTGAVLSGSDFSHTNLKSAVFYGADLRKSCLDGAKCQNADFRGGLATGLSAVSTDFTHADFREGQIGVRMALGQVINLYQDYLDEDMPPALISWSPFRLHSDRVKVGRTLLSDSILTGANFAKADMEGVCLIGSDCSHANFEGARLHDADFRHCILTGVERARTTIKHAILDSSLTNKRPSGLPDESRETLLKRLEGHAEAIRSGGKSGAQMDLPGFDFRLGVDLKGRQLSALKAQRSIFAGLDLSGVELQGAQLQNCDFRGCNLGGADLRGAQFSGSNFTRCNFDGANLGPLVVTKDMVFPANVEHAVFRQSSFVGADLSRLKASGADFSHADLRGAEMIDTDLRECVLAGTIADHGQVVQARFDSILGMKLRA